MEERNVVTCGYCEQMVYFQYDEKSRDRMPPFFCEVAQCARYYDDPICARFVLRSGVYTQRWYPGKPIN